MLFEMCRGIEGHPTIGRSRIRGEPDGHSPSEQWKSSASPLCVSQYGETVDPRACAPHAGRNVGSDPG